MTTAVLPDRTSTPAIPASPSRRVFFDAARLLAAFAIVWLHTMQSPALLPSTAIGRFAVPFFTAAAVFLLWESLAQGRRRTLSEYIRNRFVRLYLPFLAWTVIYLLFKFGKSVLTPNQPNDFPGLMLLVSGGFYHLWFLPFILVVSVLVFATGRKIIGNPMAEWRLCLVSTMLGTALAIAPIPASVSAAGDWLGYWWSALPSVFWSLAFAIIYRYRQSDRLMTSSYALLGLAVTVAATAWTWHVGRSLFAENLAGLSFLIFALGTWQGAVVRTFASFGPLAYGIYLSHLLFIKTCEAVASVLQWPESASLDIATFAIAAIGGTALTWALRRHLSTRWLVAS
jgi:surface polysaccharide O-acyltransferase-like enzyme